MSGTPDLPHDDVTLPEPEELPDRELLSVPGYRVIREIDAGGQGVVLEAEQVATKRRVALKVRHAAASETARRRFAREAELLARLRHEGIVQVHDGGDDGRRQWIAMELLDGLDLSRHVSSTRPSTREIVRIAAEAAEAVHHAHVHGVLHRDIKPSNICVTRAGVVKVLDFGAADDLAPGAGSMTATGDFVGTLAYAAPERLSAEEGRLSDVRADVYSLGVVLYEMLCGSRPHAETHDLAEHVLRVRGQEPVAPRKLVGNLDADLETILLRSLAREPARRYPSAEALASDLRAWLAGEPIAAKRDGALETLRRRARRYRIALVVLAAALLMTATGAMLVFRQMERAVEAEERASVQALEAARLGRIAERRRAFLHGLFDAVDIVRTGRSEVTADEIMEIGRQSLASMPGDSPETRADLMLTLGWLFERRGRFTDALALYEESLALETKLHEEGHRHLTDLHQAMARLLTTMRRLDEAREHLALAKQGAPESRGLRIVEGFVLLESGQHQAALDVIRDVLAHCDDCDEGQIVNLMEQEGRALGALGDQPGAIASFRLALDRALAMPNEKVQVANLYNALGIALWRSGDDEAAAREMEESLRRRLELYGPDHASVGLAHSNLGPVYRRLNRLPDAEKALREAVRIAGVAGTDQSAAHANTLTNLAGLLVMQGRREDAIPLLEQAVALTRKASPTGQPVLVRQLGMLGMETAAAGRPREAEPHLREAVELALRLLGEKASETAWARLWLAHGLALQGRDDEARRELAAASASLPEGRAERPQEFAKLVTKIEGLLD